MNNDKFGELQLQAPTEEELQFCDCGMFNGYHIVLVLFG